MAQPSTGPISRSPISDGKVASDGCSTGKIKCGCLSSRAGFMIPAASNGLVGQGP